MCTSGAISTIDAHGNPVILLFKTSDYRRTGNWFGAIKGSSGHDIIGGNRSDVPGVYAGLNRVGLSACRTYFDYREGPYNNYSEIEISEQGFCVDKDFRGLIGASMIELCTSVNEGIAYLKRILPKHCYKDSDQKGASFILADAKGNIAVLESCNGRIASKIYEDGIIARGNNGLLIFLKEQETLSNEIQRDRKERYNKMLETLTRIKKNLKKEMSKEQAIEEIKYTLCWHGPDGNMEPGAICAHGVNAPGARTNSSERFQTNAAVIFDIVDRKMFYVGGQPCKSTWHTVEFD